MWIAPVYENRRYSFWQDVFEQWMHWYILVIIHINLCIVVFYHMVKCYNLSCTGEDGPESPNNSSLPLSQKTRSKNAWLFNITQDLYEQNDLSSTKPYLVKLLLDRINTYHRTAVTPQPEGDDLRCDPSLNGYAWKPWVHDTWYSESCISMHIGVEHIFFTLPHARGYNLSTIALCMNIRGQIVEELFDNMQIRCWIMTANHGYLIYINKLWPSVVTPYAVGDLRQLWFR